MDIRKFEIDLYWKRAAYFWTFIGLTLASYGAVLTTKKENLSVNDKFDSLFLIACCGLVFSVAWHFVNRGSKFWQRNWEFQVDLLEDKVVGSLYKTVFSTKDHKIHCITDAYPFSVSNINNILSFFVVFVFVLLLFYPNHYDDDWRISVPKVISGSVTAIFLCLLYKKGRTSTTQRNGPNPASELNPAEVVFTLRKVRSEQEINHEPYGK